MKRNFSASNLISAACEHMNKNWLIFIAITLISGLVTSAFSGSSINMNDFDPNNIEQSLQKIAQASSVITPFYWISRIVSAIFTAVVLRMAFNAIDGKKVDFDAFKMPGMVYVNYVVTSVLVGLIAGVGLILCILPGIFLAVRLQFAAMYTIDRGLSITDAIKASWHDTEGNFWGLLGTNIIIGLFSLSGILLCCVGALYTEPVAYIALAILSRVFSDTSDYTPEGTAAPIQPTSPATPQNPVAQQNEETKVDDQAGYTKQY